MFCSNGTSDNSAAAAAVALLEGGLDPSLLLDGPRRSLRKREEKSYAESPDMIIEEDIPMQNSVAPAVALNNGDVEMESEEEEELDETSAPVADLPLPKVTRSLGFVLFGRERT